jgi:drug/metabolite transporter (DMT)-like permease
VLDEQNSGKDDRALMRVIQFSSAFGLGIMGALLYSVKEVSPALKYEVSFGTAVAFLAAATLSWAFWRFVFGQRNDGGRPATSRRRWFAALSLLVIGATVVPFVCALKGVAQEKVIEIAQGTAIALGALSVLGFLFWRVTRFLNADSERNANPNGRGRNRTE